MSPRCVLTTLSEELFVAQVLAHDLLLVSADVAEFARVEGLRFSCPSAAPNRVTSRPGMRISRVSTREMRSAGSSTPAPMRSSCGRGRFAVPLFAAVLWFAVVAPATAEKLRFDRLALAEGLSQASANDVLEDRRGFLWIATQDGLNLWDGNSFEVFKRDANDETSLADNFIARMWLAPDGTIWAFHPGGQAISLLDPERRTFRRLLHDPENPATLAAASQFNTAPIVDERGRVWLGTFDAGIDVIDPGSLSVMRLRHDAEDPESLAADRVNSLLRTEDGTIWIATQDGLQRRRPAGPAGVERFETFRHDPEDPATLPDNTLFSLVADPDGRIWIGSNNGFASFEPTSGRFTRFFAGDDHPGRQAGAPGAPAFAFLGLVDQRGRLWIGHRAGLSTYDRATGEFRHYPVDPADPRSLSNRNIQDFEEDSLGYLWLASRGGGINRYDPAIDGFDVFVHDPADPQSLSNDLVGNIYQSPSGMLWFGTNSGGVSSYSPAKHKFKLYGRNPRDPATLADEAVFSVRTDRKGTLWVGTQLGGLHRYSADRRSVGERYFNDPGSPRDIGSNYVQCIYEDRAGRLWIGTGGGGLALVDAARGRVVRRYTNRPEDASSIASDGINAMMEDAGGTFWISTGAGIDLFDRDRGTFEHIQHDPEHSDTSLPQALVRGFLEDRRGGIWLATSAGLCSLDRETHAVTCHSHDAKDPNSLSHNSVMAFHEDGDGILWLATYGGGLNRFDPTTGTFSSITTHDGLPNNNLYSVLPDQQGFLWLSSNHGLVRFDPRTGELVTYDAEDGLQSNEFNDRSFYASVDGELFFGGIHGFNSFRPEALQASSFVPPVVLTSFRKLAPNAETIRDLGGLERVVIHHSDLGFAFEFAALDYSSPKRNLLRLSARRLRRRLDRERRSSFRKLHQPRWRHVHLPSAWHQRRRGVERAGHGDRGRRHPAAVEDLVGLHALRAGALPAACSATSGSRRSPRSAKSLVTARRRNGSSRSTG